MSGTSVPNGSTLALPSHSNAVTAQIIRAPGNLTALTGPAPKGQEEAEMALKLQTSPGMPFVRVTDLSVDPKGDTIYVDAFDVTGGKPIMGDRNAEGQGKALSSSSFPCKIDLATHNVDAGGKMSRQRTRWDLRRIAKAEIASYFPRMIWQRCITHAFGMRGSQTGVSWDVPLATDVDFAEIMVNTVKCPTRNRHYVLDDTNGLVMGGELVNSLSTADVWKLSRLDELALILDAMETKIPAPRITGDEQMYDSPLKGILLMPPSSYNKLITDVTSGNNLRAFQAAVEQRQKWAPNSAVFRGECGIWRGILVRKMDYTIYRDAGETVAYVTDANKLTETESSTTVAAIGATFQMERSLLMGAQTLARAEGASNSGVQAAIIENTYNAGRNFEYLGEFMGGETKFRFRFPNSAGDKQYTDNCIAIDAVAPKVAA